MLDQRVAAVGARLRSGHEVDSDAAGGAIVCGSVAAGATVDVIIAGEATKQLLTASPTSVSPKRK